MEKIITNYFTEKKNDKNTPAVSVYKLHDFLRGS